MYGWSISLQISAVTEAFSSALAPNYLPPSLTKPHHIRAQTSCCDLRHSLGCNIKNLTPFSPTYINSLLLWLYWIALHPGSASAFSPFSFFHASDVLLRNRPPPHCHSAFSLPWDHNMLHILSDLTEFTFPLDRSF